MSSSNRTRKITDRKGRQWDWTYSDLGEFFKLGKHEICQGLKDKSKYQIFSGPNKSDQEYSAVCQAMAACKDTEAAQ